MKADTFQTFPTGRAHYSKELYSQRMHIKDCGSFMGAFLRREFIYSFDNSNKLILWGSEYTFIIQVMFAETGTAMLEIVEVNKDHNERVSFAPFLSLHSLKLKHLSVWRATGVHQNSNRFGRIFCCPSGGWV